MALHQTTQDSRPTTEQGNSTFDAALGSRDVLFIEDLAERLGTSVRTIQRGLRAGTFPIPELPRFDRQHRWSAVVVAEWLANPKPVDVRRLRSVGGRG